MEKLAVSCVRPDMESTVLRGCARKNGIVQNNEIA